MRRSITLGLAAATTVAALGLPALATAANAAPASASSAATASAPHHHDWDYDGWWGTYWSSNHLAKAKGYVDVNYDHEESNRVHITGKLYDNDHRTYRQGGKCAYIKFRVSYWDDGEDNWSSSYKSYKYCGAAWLQADQLLALRRRPGPGEGLPDRPVQQRARQVRLLARHLQRLRRGLRLRRLITLA